MAIERPQQLFVNDNLVSKIMIVIILFLVLAMLIGGYVLGSMILPILVGEGTHLTNVIQSDMDTHLPGSALANATAVATDTTQGVLGVFQLLVYFCLFGLIAGYFIIALYVRTYPFLAVFWIFLIIALVVFAMIFSNAYQYASTSSTDLETFYTNWGTNHFMMTYLPHIVAVIGILGGILLFTLISKDPESEQGVI